MYLEMEKKRLLFQAIAEAEKRAKVLKDEQRSVREAVNDNAKQTKMWSDLEKLFECKKKCLEQVRKNDTMVDMEEMIHGWYLQGLEGGGGTVHRGHGSETLVL